MYNCPESIYEGYIETYKYYLDASKNLVLELVGVVNTMGTSTCFLAIDKKQQNILVVNYWTSSISIHPLLDGIPQESIFTFYSNLKININNIEDHLKDRQNESHNHSLYFINENLIVVPDLGNDTLKFFNYNYHKIELIYTYKLKSGSGPRYLQILDNYLYVVNELDSSVSVIYTNITSTECVLSKTVINNKININKKVINKIVEVKEIQRIKTIPKNYKDKNTCGNIILYTSELNNNYIFASNRGHNSIAVYKIYKNNKKHQISLINIISTIGKTPRHFTIHNNKLIIANQDSHNIVIYDIKNNDNNIKFYKLHNIDNVNLPNYVMNII